MFGSSDTVDHGVDRGRELVLVLHHPTDAETTSDKRIDFLVWLTVKKVRIKRQI